MIERVITLLVVVVLVAIAAWWYRRSTGIARAVDATFNPTEARALGLPGGRTALLLFTSPGCASCAAAKRVLDSVSAGRDVEIVVADVTDHSEIAAAQHVYRAPTIFVVDERRRALSRISGVPRAGELEQMLSPLTGARAELQAGG